jgi:hypothetical protein
VKLRKKKNRKEKARRGFLRAGSTIFAMVPLCPPDLPDGSTFFKGKRNAENSTKRVWLDETDVCDHTLCAPD